MKFIEILQEYNIPYKTEGHHHCRPGWVNFDCPYCGKGTNKWHMGFSLADKYCNCWRCGVHNVISVVAELTGLSFAKVKNLVDGIDSYVQATEKVRGKLVMPKGVGGLLPAHKKYLKNRGFDYKELVKFWEIGGIGIAAKLAWRIFIPIYFKGNIVSWTTRSISNNGRRYMSASVQEEAINHKHLLYGSDYASHTIIIFEGPTDVWRVGPGGVATLGLNYSQAQVAKMVCYPIRYVCFDNEPVAQKRAAALCDTLSLFKGKTYNITLDSKDAGCAKPREINKLKKLLQT